MQRIKIVWIYTPQKDYGMSCAYFNFELPQTPKGLTGQAKIFSWCFHHNYMYLRFRWKANYSNWYNFKFLKTTLPTTTKITLFYVYFQFILFLPMPSVLLPFIHLNLHQKISKLSKVAIYISLLLPDIP